MTERTPNTFVVGAGPVATALAGALRRGGVPVLGLWARRPAAARVAGAMAGVAAYSAAPPDLLLEADVVLVAVRDEAIADVAEMLCGTGLLGATHTLLHCSGACSAEEAFSSVADRVAGVGTMHPLRAIADGRSGIRALPGAVFGVEGTARGKAAALALVQAIGGTPLELSGAQMAAYHAAAALASNYVVALIDAASAALATAGVEGEALLGALLPLARGALDNIEASGIDGGLTGPLRRGDAGTVARHLEALGGSSASELYCILAQRALLIARRAQTAPSEQLDAIERLLHSASASSAVAKPRGIAGAER